MDLPPADRAGTSASAAAGSSSGTAPRRSVPGAQTAETAAAPAGSSPVVPASAEEPAEFVSRSPSGYGYAPEYRWLRGKLEYSQLQRRWKLRYIPVDGETDAFGGSVVLADDSVLSGCERGDFVEVHGRLGNPQDPGDFAPEYVVSELRPLDRRRR
jgi:hypothetical protein